MSNALWQILSSGFAAVHLAASPDRVASTPSEPYLSAKAERLLIGFLAFGIIVLIVWAIRRIASPKKLSLDKVPGRANVINPFHLILVFLLWQIPGAGAAEILKRTPLATEQALIVTNLIRQVVGLVLVLIVAKYCFRGGLLRGLGLSMRHWGFDTGRGVVGFLAVFPICLGLERLFTWILKSIQPDAVQPHVFLVALNKVGPAWQVGIVFLAVVLGPLLEEILFRGLLQSMLRRYLRSPWGGVLISSAIFALFHIRTPQNIPALFVLGVVLGYNYERCGRLWPVILIHMLFNGVIISLHLLE